MPEDTHNLINNKQLFTENISNKLIEFRYNSAAVLLNLSFNMGGDAFPGTRRLTEEEYKRICENITVVIHESEINGIRLGFPVEVKDKAELCLNAGKGDPYGDVDVIIGIDDESQKPKIINSLIRSLGSADKQPLKNDGQYSLLTKERYQVDVLFCPVQKFDFLLAFKGNNDFGALLGHLLTPFKLKWSCQGLILKLEVDSVANIGTLKSDFVLTDNPEDVCNFLGIPHYCLDGKTRMSSQEIFNVLTTCKLYFNNNDYDQKYKIKERRKRRPVADAFFTALEKNESCNVENINTKIFPDDEGYKVLTDYRNKTINYDEYLGQISDLFGKKDEVKSRIDSMRNKSNSARNADAKFNYYILRNWYPQLDPVKAGKLFARLKSSKSGSGSKKFTNWIEDTSTEAIRRELDELLKVFDT